MTAILLMVVIAVAFSISLLLVRRTRGTRTVSNVRPRSEVQGRLLTRLREGREYRVFVRTDLDRNSPWMAVDSERDGVLGLAAGRDMTIDRVRAFVVAYPSGEVLDAMPGVRPLPEGVHWVGKPAEADLPSRREAPTEEEIRTGAAYMTLAFGPSVARPKNPTHYSTSLTNVSRERLRIVAFGAYAKIKGAWALNTITEEMFTSRQFREWYGTRDEHGWVAPGEIVKDPNNYGSRSSLWAYFGETESGATFVVAGVPAETKP